MKRQIPGTLLDLYSAGPVVSLCHKYSVAYAELFKIQHASLWRNRETQRAKWLNAVQGVLSSWHHFLPFRPRVAQKKKALSHYTRIVFHPKYLVYLLLDYDVSIRYQSVLKIFIKCIPLLPCGHLLAICISFTFFPFTIGDQIKYQKKINVTFFFK